MSQQIAKIEEYSKTEAALVELGSKYKGVIYPVNTAKGLDDAKKARAEVRGYRVEVEKVRKDLKADVLERGRLIDGEAKRITAELEALENPIDEQIKTEETRKERERQERAEAEAKRVASIKELMAIIQRFPLQYQGKPSAEILTGIALAEQIEIADTDYQEFKAEAEAVKAQAIETLKQWAEVAANHEAEQARIAAERAELEKLRAEAETRRLEDERKAKEEEAKLRAEREAQEAELKAQREAEQKRIDAERAEHEAKLKAEREAQQAELERQREAQSKADAEAKAQREAEEARLNALRLEQEAKERADRELKEAEEKAIRDAEIERQRKAAKDAANKALKAKLKAIEGEDSTVSAKLMAAYELGRADMAAELNSDFGASK